MSDTNISCPTFYPQGECSGNGICDHATGMCICNPGWSDIGDFSVTPGAACSLNIQALRIMYGVSILFPFILFIVCLRFFHQRISRWKFSRVHWNDPVMMFPFFLMGTGLSMTIFAILKIIDPVKYSVGNSQLATAIFFFYCHCTFGGVFLYVEVLLKFLVVQTKIMTFEARDRTQAHCEKTKFGVRMLQVVSITTAGIPGILITNPQAVGIVSTIFFISLAVMSTILTVFLINSLNAILFEIKNHLEKYPSSGNQSDQNYKTLAALQEKLTKAKLAIINLVPPPIIFYFIFGVWPLLARNSSYMWALVTFAGSNVSTPMVLSVIKDSDESTEGDRNSKGVAILPLDHNHEAGNTTSPNSNVEVNSDLTPG